MKPARPRTPQEFVKQVQALVQAGRDREALAFAEQFSREFLPRLTAEELNRLSGTMEGAQMIVDRLCPKSRSARAPHAAQDTGSR